MATLLVKQIPVGTMQNFVYLLSEPTSAEAIAVDSGWETSPIMKVVGDERLKVKFVVSTHDHFDHTETIRELASKTGAVLVNHEKSRIPRDRSVMDGDVLTIGETHVRVLHTPGHTEESLCLYDGKNLFTGDTLFIGSFGRTDLPGGSTKKLFHSLHDVILKLPRETVIYPGHDYGEVPFRTLGEESRMNPGLLAKDLEEFLSLFS